jgi:hypothetical protein
MEKFKRLKPKKTIKSSKKIFLKMVYKIIIVHFKKLNKNKKMVKKGSKIKMKNNLVQKKKKKKKNKISFKAMENLKYRKKKRNPPHRLPLLKINKNKKWIKKMMILKNF